MFSLQSYDGTWLMLSWSSIKWILPPPTTIYYQIILSHHEPQGLILARRLVNVLLRSEIWGFHSSDYRTMIFWNLITCSVVDAYQHCRGICCCHLQMEQVTLNCLYAYTILRGICVSECILIFWVHMRNFKTKVIHTQGSVAQSKNISVRVVYCALLRLSFCVYFPLYQLHMLYAA